MDATNIRCGSVIGSESAIERTTTSSPRWPAGTLVDESSNTNQGKHMKLTKVIKRIPFSPTSLRATIASALVVALFTSAVGCKPQAPEAEPSGAGVETAESAAQPVLLDDYSDPVRNNNGVERLLVDDKTAGSQSRATQRIENGVLSVAGELVPGRGVPAFISLASPIAADGTATDLSSYSGVRLRVKGIQGIFCVQVASAGITNYDYHTSAPLAGGVDGFQEVRVPFKELKRAWSEQIPLDLKTITSVNLVSFGMARGAFAYEVDEIGFY